MKITDIQWSKNLFASMREGATWGVPRSGLIFTKRGNKLILTERMPYTRELAIAGGAGADVPETEDEMNEYQRADFNAIAAHFVAAGVETESSISFAKPI